MFGTDVIVVQHACLFLGKHNYATGTVRKSLKHFATLLATTYFDATWRALSCGACSPQGKPGSAGNNLRPPAPGAATAPGTGQGSAAGLRNTAIFLIAAAAFKVHKRVEKLRRRRGVLGFAGENQKTLPPGTGKQGLNQVQGEP
ncbi:hypothetical protein ARTHROSP310_25050 [Arthrobacter sp. AD-310]